MVSFTFAKGRRAVPLRWMTRNTADDDLSDKFVALITEESQSFSSLVGVLVKSLVTIVGDSRVWTWVIFYCLRHTKHTEDSHVRAADSKHAEMQLHKQTRSAECRKGTYRHTLGCGRSIWGYQCLVRSRRFGWDLPADNPGYRRNEPLSQRQSLFRGARSVLRLPPLLGQGTAVL